MTRTEFFQRFKYGINIGNALECFEPCDTYEREKTTVTVDRNVIDQDGVHHDFKIHVVYRDNTSCDFYNWEELWRNPMITQDFFYFLRDEGYDHIRLPININRHYLNIKTQEIDPLWIKHIKEVINMAKNAGLPVIVPLHNDLSDLIKSSASFQSLYDDEYTIYQDNTSRVIKIWNDLATALRDYSTDDVIFELIAEMMFIDISWSDNDKACMILKKLFQILLKTVRSTGGNNSERLVAISGHHAELEMSLPFMENFDEEFDKNCILGFVFYQPYQFTITDLQKSWGTEDDIKQLNSAIEAYREAFEKGIPFFIHEYAAGVSVDNNADKNVYDVCNWIYLVTRNFAKIGIPMTYWDPGSLINRDTFKYKIPFFRDMINAALNDEDFDIQKAVDANPVDLREWWER